MNKKELNETKEQIINYIHRIGIIFPIAVTILAHLVLGIVLNANANIY